MSEEIKGKCYQEHEPNPDNPCEIKTMVCNDIEIPAEFLKHNFVIVDGKKYIELQQEKQQLKEVIEKAREYTKKEIEFNERQIEAYKTCINTNVYGEFSKETKENMEKCITLSIGICWKMKDLLQILDKVKNV